VKIRPVQESCATVRRQEAKKEIVLKNVVMGICALLVMAGVASVNVAVAGEPLDLAAHQGEVVVVDFWASWCKPCRLELPWLAAMQTKHGAQGLAVLTVNLDRDRADADRLLASLAVDLPVIHDPDGKIAAAHKLEGMPTSLIYGRDGTLRATRVGFVPEDEAKFEALLLNLLKESDDDAQKH
jgi:thiol-disulfide isomerase/thioredoxin